MSMTTNKERVSNYYNVNLGKIVKSLGKVEPTDMTGITPRVNKNGETVYEIIATGIRGKVIALGLKQPEQGKEDFGAKIVFTMQSEQGEKAILECKFDSAYGRSFMQVLPDLDFSKEIEFEPYQYLNKKTGKNTTGMSVYQDGAKLDWNYTRANPNGLPPLEKITFKGKDAWDNTNQLAYFTSKLEEAIQKVSGMTPAPVSAPVDAGNEAPMMPEDDNDDVPF